MFLRFIIILIMSVTSGFAGDVSSEITPSPAPSKTPTAESDDDLDTEATDDSEEVRFMEPFTQSDLSVLTGNVQRPNGAIWHNGKIYAVCNGDWTIYELEADTGSTQTYIYGVRNGHTLYVDELSDTEIDLWVPDYDTNTLLRINRSRAPQSIVTNMEGPWGIAFLDEDHFLVTNLLGNSISLINRDGTSQELVNDLRSPTGIAIHDEFVFVANNGSARRSLEWGRVNDLLESLAEDEVADEMTMEPLVSGLQNTTGVVLGEDEMLYFAYALGTRGVVGRVDPVRCMESGGCTNDQVEIVLYTELAAPLAGLTISPDMRLYVHTIFRPEIYWVQLEQSD